MKSIEHSVVFDTRFLFSIQVLVVAGFRSRHEAVVTKSIVMWNNTFGGEDTLEYPEDLKIILQKLRPLGELRLPNFPESNDEEVSRLHFATLDARADVARSYLRLCILSTSNMKRRCSSSLSCPLLGLLSQLVHYNVSQGLSRACRSVRIQGRLLNFKVRRLQPNREPRLLQSHAYDMMIPKSNSPLLNRHLLNLNLLSHNI